MNGNQFRQALHSGEKIYGTLIVSHTPRYLEFIDGMGLDFVFIDTEHVALDRTALSWMCQGYRAKGLTPLVRIPSPDPYEATQVLDGGALGIVAPYVETAEEVRALVGAVKLRPLKGKKNRNILEGKLTRNEFAAQYIEAHTLQNSLVVNIESETALENLEEIAAVPGLDAFLVGPHDLSTSLGIPEEYDHPKFIQAVDQILKTARKYQLGAGVHVIYANQAIEQQIRWAALGANLIVHSADIIAFQRGISRDIAEIRNGIDGKSDTRKTSKEMAI